MPFESSPLPCPCPSLKMGRASLATVGEKNPWLDQNFLYHVEPKDGQWEDLHPMPLPTAGRDFFQDWV